MEKILLDTDIGSDIDDAVCLAYLLAQPQCELLGITTVSGEGRRRAMMASAQCKLAGRAIPIHIGAELPLLVESRQPKSPQTDALERWPHDTDFSSGTAVEFLRSIIRANPGEVTLLGIGPLTNIALLFASDPEIPSLLKGLVLMGGLFDLAKQRNSRGGRWEWNIWCDPHAAAIVYRANIRRHRSYGLDVTQQVVMNAAEVRERFTTKLLLPVLDFAEVWFKQTQKITFHDPLAAASIFVPELCGYERGDVRVDIHDHDYFGVTRFTPRADATQDIATSVDAGAFFKHYFEVVGAAEV